MEYDPDTVLKSPCSAGTFEPYKDLHSAYDGTSIFHVRDILGKGLQVGPSSTQGTLGIYREGKARQQCCLNYMTHGAIEKGSPYVWAVMLELKCGREGSPGGDGT